MGKLKYIFICAITLLSATLFAPLANALTVSPARIEITGDPGTTITGTIELFNEQEGLRTFYTSFENFEPSNDSGAPHFIGAESGLATWIRSESEISIASGGRHTVPFSISIPSDAHAGGHFGAIFFGSQAPNSSGGGEVSIGGKIGVLVLLRVSGEITEDAGLVEFGTVSNKKIFSTLPIGFVYRINNVGDDRIAPNGELRIKNFGIIPSATLLANAQTGSVLPNSIRKFEVAWNGKEDMTAIESAASNEEEQVSFIAEFFEAAYTQLRSFHFGWYQAHLSLVWGEGMALGASSTYYFFIIPWQLLSLVFLFLIPFILIVKYALKQYKKRIIAQTLRAHKKRSKP